MKTTEKLIYRNENNQEVEISYFSPYIPVSVDETLGNSIVASKQIGKDGMNYASSTLDSRDIRVKGSIIIRHNIDTLERRLRSVFNPKLSGKLIFRTETTEKVIDVKAEEVINFKRSKGISNFTIDLVAHNPYWREVDRTEYLALLSGRLSFPLVINQGVGMMFGLRQSILETEIENVGDVASGFRVVFKAKGIVRNPEIENKLTGEKIKILVDMAKGDIIEIINTPSRKMVNINGVKSFKNLDRLNSSFFELEVGKNLIGYNAEENAINLDVILYYSPLYLGR